MMIGERIREARAARQMSLSEVAAKARVSTATLSRIENGKQSIDVSLLLQLADIFHTPSSELLGDDAQASSVADQIASLKPADRVQLWRELSTTGDAGERRRVAEDLTLQLDELVAQLDFLRTEVERLRTKIHPRHGIRRRS